MEGGKEEVSLKNVLENPQLEGVPEDKILNVYQYGSRVYGVANPDSDWDFVVIVSDDTEIKEYNSSKGSITTTF
jgi:hypothetical protein